MFWRPRNFRAATFVFRGMVKFLLWCILFVLCWPVAVLALIAYPIVWIVLLPFRLVGIAVSGVLQVIWTLITLPALLFRQPLRPR